MKLAEALQERADIQARLAQVRRRLRLNARVQEGEKPAEDPKDLLHELDSLISRLEELIARINKTNAETLDEGSTLTALIARRDCLRTKTDALREFLDEASDVASRAARSEIRILSTVPVAEKRRELDKLAQSLRQLDARIQQRNWLTELL
ncbi:MAG: DIP1984 family protein [Desulfovibrionaceae bacterium]|nr:DIP1984 family protein [Desulfovibrionaceae bacterium]